MLDGLKASVLIAALAAFFATPALAQEPYAQPDDTWISLSGTVDEVFTDEFLLDYGEGIVTVEMDDGDRDADAYKLLEDDSVTVTGMVDDDFFETTTIEASSVYVEKLDTYFYASAVDEEDAFVTITTPVVVSQVVVQGTVTDVRDEEFTLNTGLRSITVEVEEMPYNPLDDDGFQQVELGDVVSVRGVVDDDFLEGREVVANAVVTLGS